MPLAYLTVKRPDGSVIHVDADLRTRVDDFKRFLAAKCKVPPEKQRLLVAGRVLQDMQYLQHCGVDSGSTIYLLIAGAEEAQSPEGDLISMTKAVESRQTLLFTNPDIMHAMMESEPMRAVLGRPDFLRELLESNPDVRDLMQRHPEFRSMLGEDDFMAEARTAFANAMENPMEMLIKMRTADAAVRVSGANQANFDLLRSMAKDLAALKEADEKATQAFGARIGSKERAQKNPDDDDSPRSDLEQDAERNGGEEVAEGPKGPAWVGTFDPNAMVAMIQDPSMQQLLAQLRAGGYPPGRKPLAEDPWLDQDFYAKIFQAQTMQAMVTMQRAVGVLGADALPQQSPPTSAPAKTPKSSTPAGKNTKGSSRKPSSVDMQQPSEPADDAGVSMALSGLSLESPAANFRESFAVIMQAQSENPEILYAGQLKAMHNMGFTNRDANVRLLHKFGGNMAKALDALVVEQVAAMP